MRHKLVLPSVLPYKVEIMSLLDQCGGCCKDRWPLESDLSALKEKAYINSRGSHGKIVGVMFITMPGTFSCDICCGRLGVGGSENLLCRPQIRRQDKQSALMRQVTRGGG